MKLKRIISILSILLVLSSYSQLYSQNKTNDNESFIRERDSLLLKYIGKPYPNFKYTSLEGVTISNQDLKDKVTWINFWFEGCAPCISEFDEINNALSELKKDSSFQFFSFTIDSFEKAKESVLKYKLSYTILPVDREDVYRLNFMGGFPTNIIIDKDGNVVLIRHGGSIDKVKVKKSIKSIQSKIENILRK